MNYQQGRTLFRVSKTGVSAIRYPSGRVDSIETAIRRAVLTGVNQTAGKLQMELADEVGCDLVEVTAHAGARPSHALWQGKIYSRSGKSKKYPDFVASTGYGTGAGLCGWNCRHSFGPYIEGSPRVWTDEKLEELNEPRYEYNGQKLTEYEAQQKANYFNRQIHRWDREAEAMRAAGQDPSEAITKAREWRARQKDFLEHRDILHHGHNVDEVFKIKNPLKSVDFSKLTVEEAERQIARAMKTLEKATEEMDAPYSSVFGYQCHTAPIKVDRGSKYPFAYHPNIDTIIVNPFHEHFSDYDFSEAMIHELAHRYDRTAVFSWKNEGFINALTEAKEYAKMHLEELEIIASQYQDDFAMQDFLGIIADNVIETTSGHVGLSDSQKRREAFADLSSMGARKTNSFAVVSQAFSQLADRFIKTFEG